jgi:hypothetical protein
MIFWYIPGPEFFACRVRRRVGRAFRIEEKAFDADATPKFRDCNRVESHCLCIQGIVVNARRVLWQQPCDAFISI